MHFVKIQTSDNETRWINLEQVSRVTLGADDSGEPILAVVFADGNPDLSLKLHGSDHVNRAAIGCLTAGLDAVSKS